MENDDEQWQKRIDAAKNAKFLSESHLENFFSEEVKKAGGWAIKFDSTGTNGLPDRIIFYQGLTWLVELKTPKGTVQPIQKAVHDRFRKHGFKVRIIRDKSGVHAFVQDMLNAVL